MGRRLANGPEHHAQLVAVDQLDMAQLRRRLDGRWILIDAGDAGALFEEGESVTASSKRAVQDVPSVAEQLGDLAGENRRVKGWDSGRLGHRTRSY